MNLLHSIVRSPAAFAASLAIIVSTGGCKAEESRAAQPPAVPPLRPTIAISTLVDRTDARTKAGLDTLSAPQLEAFFELAGAEMLTLQYALIQESVMEPVTVQLPGWQLRLPPRPSARLPYLQFKQASAAYYAALKACRASRPAWEQKTADEFRSFIQRATEAEVALETRWLEKLEKQRGRDFARSAVAEAVVAAVKALPAEATFAFLIVDSDGVDQPPGRPGRRTAFTTAELPANLPVIFVRPEGHAPDSPLFKGMTNPTTTVESLAGAVKAIIEKLKTPEEKATSASTSGATAR